MKPVRVLIALVAAAGLVAAQDQTPQNPPPPDQTTNAQTPHAWRSVNDGLPADIDQAGQPVPNAAPDPAQANPGPAAPAPQPNQTPYNVSPYPDPVQALPANYGVPPKLTIKQGTYVTVRMNGWLSSDRNQKGDTFTATLEQPLVVDGFVVAQRGQTVYGRVTEAQKAGRVEGTSRLGVELTQLTLVDGDQLPVQSQMVRQNGPTSVGRDAAVIGGTTALGAAAGAVADLGRGAAIGAGAGAAVGILGVLLTRGRPTVIYPESVITFQIQAPVDIATDKAPQAFQYVNAQQDYRNGYGSYPPRISGGPVPAPAPGYGYGYGYPAYPYPVYAPYAYGYPYPYYPYFGFGVYVGPGFYGRYYGGFRGGFYRR